MSNLTGSVSSLITSSLTRIIQNAFDKADDDGDGLLSETEFETFVDNIPTDIVELSTTDTAAAFTEADTDEDGQLSLEEVEDATLSALTTDTTESITDIYQTSLSGLLSSLSGDSSTSSKVFSYLDTDRDGTISVNEVINMYSKNASEIYNIIQQSSVITGDSLNVSA